MVSKQKLSVRDYLAMPEEPPYSEYVYGEVVQKISPVPSHVRLIDEMAISVGTYRKRVGGFSGPELRVEFQTERGPEYRLPDYCYFVPGREVGGGRFGNPPTLAIEVRSPGESMDAQREKCRYYRRYGVDVAWLIDPESRTAEIFEGDADGRLLDPGASLESPLLPGFSLSLPDLFAAID